MRQSKAGRVGGSCLPPRRPHIAWGTVPRQVAFPRLFGSSEGCLSADRAWPLPCGWCHGVPVLGLGISGPSRARAWFSCPARCPLLMDCVWAGARGPSGQVAAESKCLCTSQSHHGGRRSLCGRGVCPVDHHGLATWVVCPQFASSILDPPLKSTCSRLRLLYGPRGGSLRMCSRVIWRVLLRDGRLWLVWALGLASRPAAWAAIWLGGSQGP